MANKNLQKATKIVDKATSVFSEAITEVEKANGILAQGIEKDDEKYADIERKINSYKMQLLDIESDSSEKKQKMKENHLLIQKLKNFS